MPTENRRIAAYLPKEIDDRLETFKSDRGLKGDSQALVAILSEFFGVGQQVAHSVSHQPLSLTEDDVKQLIEKHTFQLRDQVSDMESTFAVGIERLSMRLSMLERSQSKSSSEAESSELLNEVYSLRQQVEALESEKRSLTLSTGELARRLGIASSTLSHWKSTGKKGKSPEELLKATREKDPDDIGWLVILETGRFKPERELPGNS